MPKLKRNKRDQNYGNVRIAAFMGCKIGKLSGWIGGSYGVCAYTKEGSLITAALSVTKLDFKTWDRIMPVYERIAVSRNIEASIQLGGCIITDTLTGITYKSPMLPTNDWVAEIWEAVTDFIIATEPEPEGIDLI